MLANTLSAALLGIIDALPVLVEVNTGEVGELKFILVGLPDAAVKESQDRVFSAISNSGYRQPETHSPPLILPLATSERKVPPMIYRSHCGIVLAAMKQCELQPSQIIRDRCAAARERQFHRFGNHPADRYNSRMQSAELRKYCALDAPLCKQLEQAMLEFSSRALRPYSKSPEQSQI